MGLFDSDNISDTERKGRYANFGIRHREGSIVEIKINSYDPYELRDKNTVPNFITIILSHIFLIVLGCEILITRSFG